MHKKELIAARQFCVHHNIELSFIFSLKESGLIDVTSIDEEIYLPENQLRHLELLMQLKREMDINLEGIETITYLLQRIQSMKQEIVQLNNKLAFYESE